jgi:hypothetical protein
MLLFRKHYTWIANGCIWKPLSGVYSFPSWNYKIVFLLLGNCLSNRRARWSATRTCRIPLKQGLQIPDARRSQSLYIIQGKSMLLLNEKGGDSRFIKCTFWIYNFTLLSYWARWKFNFSIPSSASFEQDGGLSYPTSQLFA